MIYGVEGNVNVGKSTFIKKYAKQHNLDIVEESKFVSDLQPIERQFCYINQEINKHKTYLNKNIIMDRTILSVYLYTMFSNEFKEEEKQIIFSSINKEIENGRVLIPNKLFFIIYPFELINNNHLRLKEEKETQDLLVDYNYYLKYNLFFTNLLINGKLEIIKTQDNRQLIQLNDNTIYHNLNGVIPENKRIILMDKKENNFEILTNHQKVNRIIDEINNLNVDNQTSDKCFLSEIINLLYPMTKPEKINILTYIMAKVPLYMYISQIIYINDNNKNKRLFYHALKRKMAELSNITITDDDNLEKVSNINNRELLLVDLFYYIRDIIEKDEM